MNPKPKDCSAHSEFSGATSVRAASSRLYSGCDHKRGELDSITVCAREAYVGASGNLDG